MKEKNILCAALLALGFLLTVKGGRICWRETGSEAYIDTGKSAASLPCEYDRALLSQGLILPDRAGLTRALEDFCS